MPRFSWNFSFRAVCSFMVVAIRPPVLTLIRGRELCVEKPRIHFACVTISRNFQFVRSNYLHIWRPKLHVKATSLLKPIQNNLKVKRKVSLFNNIYEPKVAASRLYYWMFFVRDIITSFDLLASIIDMINILYIGFPYLTMHTRPCPCNPSEVPWLARRYGLALLVRIVEFFHKQFRFFSRPVSCTSSVPRAPQNTFHNSHNLTLSAHLRM